MRNTYGHKQLSRSIEPNKKGITDGRAIMSVIAFKEKAHVLAEEQGWPLSSAKGYFDGETFRKRHKEPPLHALVGIDDYSEGFRAGYFHRSLSERALSDAPPAQGTGFSSFPSASATQNE